MAEKRGEDKARGRVRLIAVQVSANSCGVAISPRNAHTAATGLGHLIAVAAKSDVDLRRSSS